jgi:hypothetical protein
VKEQKNIYAVDYYYKGLLYSEQFAGASAGAVRRVLKGVMPGAVVCKLRIVLAGVWA